MHMKASDHGFRKRLGESKYVPQTSNINFHPGVWGTGLYFGWGYAAQVYLIPKRAIFYNLHFRSNWRNRYPIPHRSPRKSKENFMQGSKTWIVLHDYYFFLNLWLNLWVCTKKLTDHETVCHGLKIWLSYDLPQFSRLLRTNSSPG